MARRVAGGVPRGSREGHGTARAQGRTAWPRGAGGKGAPASAPEGQVTVKKAAAAARQRARRAAVTAGGYAGAVGAAGMIQAAHGTPLLPAGPYALMTASAIGALKARDGYEALRERRAGGKAAARRRRKYQGTASAREVHGKLSVTAARRRAKVTRPSLNGETRRLPAAGAGVVIGRAGRPRRTVMGTAEDFYLIFAPPRSGKTGLMSGMIADAPGAVLATSTRTDVYAHTALTRARKGPVYVLNPGGDGGIPTNLAWSPLDGCEHPAAAIERAGYLMNAAPKDQGGKDAWWDGRGHVLLRLMLHAAALGGCTMADAAAWVRDPLAPLPHAILGGHRSAAPGWARELAAMTEAGGDMLNGIIASADAALSWMADPALAAIACPPPGTGFSALDFLGGQGTIYMIGTDRPHSSFAPYFACLAAHLFDTGKRLASVSPGGRLDPPVSLVIDEPAITCPVPLDRWAAEAGGHGFTVITGVQSPAQLARWGGQGARTIRDCATIQLVFGGRTDQAELEALSALCGERDTWEHAGAPGGRTRQPGRERLFPPERIRTLDAMQAVLLHRNARPLLARITPVWDRPGYERAAPGTLAGAAPRSRAQVPALEAAPDHGVLPSAVPPRRPAIEVTADGTPCQIEENQEWQSQQVITSRTASAHGS